MRLKITGGRLVDPANSWDGVIQDLYIDQDRFVTHLDEVDRVIEAPGQLVVPGGIELRGRVAGFGLNYLHLWRPTPTLSQCGEAYAALGYTHVHEPFLTLDTANYVHQQLAALPVVDTSASLVVNLRDFDRWLQSTDSLREVADTLLVLLSRTRSLDLRIYEPFVRYRQEFYAHRTLSVEKTLEVLAALSQHLSLKISLEASPELLGADLPDPEVFHLASLGSAVGGETAMAAALKHLDKGATADMGLLPPSSSLPCQDRPFWVDLGFFRPVDLCPPCQNGQRSRALTLALAHHGRQMAFSTAALVPDPAAYFPVMYAWLWDQRARPDTWEGVADLREYTLFDWVWATRTLPARILGFKDRGHLSPGARAEVALYDLPPEAPRQQWAGYLSRCRTLIKAGEVIIDNYHLVKPQVKKTTWFRATDLQPGPMLMELCQYRTFRPEHIWVHPDMDHYWDSI